MYCIHPPGHVSVILGEERAYLALWVCCECTDSLRTPLLTSGLYWGKSSHSSVAAKPPYGHIGVCVHKQVHSLPSIVSSFHTLKTHNPLSQSTGCNIPVSHPGLSTMTSLYRERLAYRLQGMSWLSGSNLIFRRLSLLWALITQQFTQMKYLIGHQIHQMFLEQIECDVGTKCL